jgi:hypothetical protein
VDTHGTAQLWASHISRRTDNCWSKRVIEWRPRLGKRSVGRPQVECRFAQDGWQELDVSSRGSSEKLERPMSNSGLWWADDDDE